MTQEPRSIAAIILAAGRSSRMGSHKLLLPFNGHPLVRWVVEAALASGADPVIVVVGHGGERVRAALPDGRLIAILNPSYAEGMSTSLRVGLGALPANLSGALILLGDQPLITAATINAMIDASAAAPDAIIAASYQGRRGNPVLFPHQYFAELEAVTGDEGGRSLLARYPEWIRLVEIDDAQAGLDIDTPAEYQAFLSESALDTDDD